MLFKRKTKTNLAKPDSLVHTFPYKGEKLVVRTKKYLTTWFEGQSLLFEAIYVALSIHILAYPIVWFIGWALPWPKPPLIKTVIEINLENWPNEAIPEKVTDIINSQMHPKK